MKVLLLQIDEKVDIQSEILIYEKINYYMLLFEIYEDEVIHKIELHEYEIRITDDEVEIFVDDEQHI